MKRVSFFCILSVLATALIAACPAVAFTPQSPPPPTKNTYQLIAGDKDLSTFAKMIDDAGLKDLFTDRDVPVTVFAPTNDALDGLSRDEMNRIEANPASLQGFVKYHVITGSVVSSGSIRGRRASPAAANGETLQFDGLDRSATPKVNGAPVGTEFPADNGIVLVMNGPLMPPSLARTASPSLPVPQVPKLPVPPPPPVAAAPPVPPVAAPPVKAMSVTTSGVAVVPEATPAKKPNILGSSAASVTTSGTATASPPASSSGFELFGHKFSW